MCPWRSKSLLSEQQKIFFGKKEVSFQTSLHAVFSERGSGVSARLKYDLLVTLGFALGNRDATIGGFESTGMHRGSLIQHLDVHAPVREQRKNSGALPDARPFQPLLESFVLLRRVAEREMIL